jgi:zinc protease
MALSKNNQLYENMAAQPLFFLQQELYAYLMKENPRFNGIVQLKILGADGL